mgnify:CR=1 FL=1
MATVLKGKIPWYKKYHPRRFWHLAKVNWKTTPSITQQLRKDRDGYLILLGGVILGYLIAIYIIPT